MFEIDRPKPFVALTGVILSLTLALLEVTYGLLFVRDPGFSFAGYFPAFFYSLLTFFLGYIAFWLVLVWPLRRLCKLHLYGLTVAAILFYGVLFAFELVFYDLAIMPYNFIGFAERVVLCLPALVLAAACYLILARVEITHGQFRQQVSLLGALPFLAALAFVFALLVRKGSYPLFAFTPWLVLGLSLGGAVVLVLVFLRLNPAQRGYLPLGLLVCTGALALATRQTDSGLSAGHFSEQRPISRVVLLSIDTLRRSALGTYDPSAPPTPHIDQLAEDCVVFEQAYSVAPWTLPSLCSIMTGLPPSVHRANVRDSRLPERLDTLAEIMLENGYQTGIVGYNPFLNQGLQQGFQTRQIYPKKIHWESFGYRVAESVFPAAFKADPGTEDLTAYGTAWLEEKKDDPFFLWLHYFDPHLPYEPPERFMPEGPAPAGMGRRFVGTDRLGNPWSALTKIEIEWVRRLWDTQWGRSPEKVAWIKGLYEGEVRYVDENVGQFIAKLKALGLYDETLIVLTSDHGEEFWEHGRFEHAHSLYNEVIAVPLMVKLPGSRHRGRVADFVSTQNIMATILDLCQIPRQVEDPYTLSLAPYLQPGESKPAEQPIVGMASLYYKDLISVIAGGKKLIHTLDPAQDEYYDLLADPGETKNIAQDDSSFHNILGQYGAQAKAMKESLNLQDDDNKAENIDRKSLRSLGYL